VVAEGGGDGESNGSGKRSEVERTNVVVLVLGVVVIEVKAGKCWERCDIGANDNLDSWIV
jgi:hypothetical protein